MEAVPGTDLAAFAKARRTVRIVCTAAVLISLAPVPILWIVLSGVSQASTPGPAMLWSLGVVTAVDLAASVFVYYRYVRAPRHPVFYTVAAIICCIVPASSVLLAFLGSLTYHSVVPYVLVLVGATVLWVLVWPRGLTDEHAAPGGLIEQARPADFGKL
jgi:hypothetical protein